MELNSRMEKLKLSIRQIAELASGTPDCVRFDIGQPCFDTPRHIKEGAIKAINDGFTGYTSCFGTPELREAVAEKESEKGLTINANNVLITTGGMGALNCCILNILGPRDEIIVSNPFWSTYELIVANAHGNLVKAKFFEDNKFDPSNIEKSISKRTRAILINSPENPTGRVLEKKDLEEIAEIARENDLHLVSDEVYEKIVFDNTKHCSIAAMAPERTFLANSCSKTYAMTGWRIGWIIAPEESINTLVKTNNALSACPSSIGQKAAYTALTGPQDCIESMRKEYQKRRDYAVKKLKSMGLDFVMPRGAFYVFPDVKREPWQFALDLMKKKKVSVVPGDSFGSEGKTCVRLALTIDMDSVKTGLERIEEYLNS